MPCGREQRVYRAPGAVRMAKDPSDPGMDLSDPRVPPRIPSAATKRLLADRITVLESQAEALPKDLIEPTGLYLAFDDAKRHLQANQFEIVARILFTVPETLLRAQVAATARAAKTAAAGGGRASAKERQNEATALRSQVRRYADALLDAGKDRREIVGIIVGVHGLSTRTVSRHLMGYRRPS